MQFKNTFQATFPEEKAPCHMGQNGTLQENDKILKNYDKLHKMITKI